MKKLSLLLFLLFLSSEIFAKPDKIKVLIIDGYSNHDWRYSTQIINTLLINSGFCTVDISTAPTNDSPNYNNWNPDFSKYNVVVQNGNSLGNGNSWPKPVQTNFESYMKNGGGMYVFHSANNSFPEWEEYNKMIGLGWRKADQGVAIEIRDDKMVKIPVGEGEGTSHGARVDLVVNVLKSHPINKGIPAKWKTPDIELYTYARGPAENLEVLSYTFDEKTGKNWPVDWVVNYGKGRIYDATFGHMWHDQRMPPGIQCVGFQTTFLRAIQWLAEKKVTVEVPKNFPSENALSLNPFELVFSETDGVNRWIYPSMPDWKISENDVPKTALQTKLVYADDKPDTWNTMEIVCEGMKIRTFVNGNLVSNFDGTGILDDAAHIKNKVGSSGKIALQLHASDELLIRYKDLKIKKY